MTGSMLGPYRKGDDMLHRVVIELDKDEILKLVYDARPAELGAFALEDGREVRVYAGETGKYTFDQINERLRVTFSRDVDL